MFQCALGLQLALASFGLVVALGSCFSSALGFVSDLLFCWLVGCWLLLRSGRWLLLLLYLAGLLFGSCFGMVLALGGCFGLSRWCHLLGCCFGWLCWSTALALCWSTALSFLVPDFIGSGFCRSIRLGSSSVGSLFTSVDCLAAVGSFEPCFGSLECGLSLFGCQFPFVVGIILCSLLVGGLSLLFSRMLSVDDTLKSLLCF